VRSMPLNLADSRKYERDVPHVLGGARSIFHDTISRGARPVYWSLMFTDQLEDRTVFVSLNSTEFSAFFNKQPQ